MARAINAGGFLAVQQYTSHMTGTVSAMADNVALGACDLVADRQRLGVLVRLALTFLCGGLIGVIGALGFKQLGCVSTLPLALLLVALAGVPATDDLVALARRWRSGH